MVCLVHFDSEICFARQQCALFQHLWSQHGVLCTFWLRHVLGAASGAIVHFLSGLAATPHHRFSEPTIRRSRATNHRKNTVNGDFCTFFSPASSFLWLFLFWSSLFFSSLLRFFPLLLFPSISAFPSVMLLAVWLLKFLHWYALWRILWNIIMFLCIPVDLWYTGTYLFLPAFTILFQSSELPSRPFRTSAGAREYPAQPGASGAHGNSRWEDPLPIANSPATLAAIHPRPEKRMTWMQKFHPEKW